MEHLRLHLPVLPAAGEVTTFYSYKGGVGRTMALANLGHMLAARPAAPVLLVDWDLEAPGLHYYFPGAPEAPGVLDLFEACRDQLQERAGRYASDSALAEAVLDAVRWEQYLVRASDDRPLWLLRAGRCDGSHAERAAMLDWQGIFDTCPALFRTFAARLVRHFGHVLVDARSGRADSAAICTTLLPTRLVLVFAPNRQNLDGLQDLVSRATGYRSCHEDEQRQLLVYPLPSRIDTADAALSALWRRGDDGYQPLFERALAHAYGLTWLSLEDYFNAVQLPYCPSLASGEPLPAPALQSGYDTFLQWLRDGLCPWQSLPSAAPPANHNNHHALPLEQQRAGYWPVPAAM
ncbi:KGGVGR-motif variant AAA ATPase [Pseudoduganella sp. OTU4001]|uniref:KGGVGR-motif variant AAA ATPase n=1 Tax=Pseudoduganella sp. OTU4001 TaxID=3043854 RepID=UPI00313B3F88